MTKAVVSRGWETATGIVNESRGMGHGTKIEVGVVQGSGGGPARHATVCQRPPPPQLINRRGLHDTHHLPPPWQARRQAGTQGERVKRKGGGSMKRQV